ncbi:MAG TPA: antibiotic biosynthesis monooxygenase [Candidatus Obscuribacterales bacterium]
MFVAVYSFKLKPNMEEQFQQAWAERTKEIIKASGSFGSRLHRNEDGTFVAYAQWPSRKAWENAAPSETAARDRMREATLSSETVFCLEVLEDLLVTQNQ